MNYNALIFEKHGHVALVTLNRPKNLNALSMDIRNELSLATEEVKNDDDIRVMVITGTGRGFCSGADLSGGGLRRSGDADELPPQNTRLDEFGWMGKLAMETYNLNKPTIAAMNGVAAGAGMSLALACDLRVGSEKTRFKTVFLERSLSPDTGMSFFLPRIVGYSRAADLIFTSRDVFSDEAYRIGLLDRIFPHETLIEDAIKLAEQMAFWPPFALRSSKRVLQHNINAGLEEALRYEVVGLDFARKSPADVIEQARSFREKRQPKFTGK